MDKTAMYALTYGLFVITARDGKIDNGCITNTVIQVTSTPNRVSVTINKANYTHDLIAKTGTFNVSVISQKAEFDLFERFGFHSGRDVDKFDGLYEYERAENGVTYITKGINAVLCAKVVASYDLGTHTTFVADVTDCWTMSKAPSCTYAYYLAEIKPKPAQNNSGKTVWRCKICGYEYEGENLPDDFVCPICKHGKDDFEKVVK
jgi:flavin reductase (DIM6/NTAB) family NADH-FMN oxidoreductase RutF